MNVSRPGAAEAQGRADPWLLSRHPLKGQSWLWLAPPSPSLQVEDRVLRRCAACCSEPCPWLRFQELDPNRSARVSSFLPKWERQPPACRPAPPWPSQGHRISSCFSFQILPGKLGELEKLTSGSPTGPWLQAQPPDHPSVTGAQAPAPPPRPVPGHSPVSTVSLQGGGTREAPAAAEPADCAVREPLGSTALGAQPSRKGTKSAGYSP